MTIKDVLTSIGYEVVNGDPSQYQEEFNICAECAKTIANMDLDPEWERME